MRKIFIILFLMLSIFTVINAHPFKTEKELNNFFSKIDQLIKEELKKDYREEMSKRKGTADGEYTFEIEDDRTVLITRNIQGIKPETEITQYFNKKGELYMISSLTSETDKELYALYRKYDKNGNLSIYTYAIDGKNTDKGYYSDGKLAYILELKLLKGKNPIPNGKYIEYYKNGQVKVQGNNKDGKRDGEFKAFLRNGKSAGSVFYKDGKIIKSTLVNSMKDNASFSLVTDINYNLNSHEIVTDEFPNQLLKQYFIFNKNGLLDGESREYYEEGDIKSIFPFKNNIPDGVFISYYQNGNIKEKHTYKNGNEEGEGLFYYQNGNIGQNSFLLNGKLVTEVFEYYPNGNMKTKAHYIDGKLNGELIIYYENGNIKEKTFTIDEKLSGDAFEYYPSGKLRNKSFFKNGKREGESLTYYENGKLKKKILYKNGMKNGFAIAYYEDGIIEQKAYFVDDKKENERLYYDKKGNLTKTEIYKNDIKQ
ncbi:phosphatidylinositol-4-phosphate 5-kinase [Fusobacterium polymorphum]|uniref:toxin-antitoxin system YwqK family antitoxin n=1 Tax=Fusobacterium nucleatum subsp. polymorphum TaxID=76857 RepID=UPI0029255279|nr:phosphatidylinositol-4-phosphate 5-kinase [Fusobacterium nucleatum]BEP06756.1 phosphatidylinositol-4-phosphate 5-kinase [Fusobacterium nucleatum]